MPTQDQKPTDKDVWITKVEYLLIPQQLKLYSEFNLKNKKRNELKTIVIVCVCVCGMVFFSITLFCEPNM